MQDDASLVRSLLDSIGDGVVVLDTAGRAILWNQGAERVIGGGARDLADEEWSQAYGLYLPDGVTLVPTDELPLVRAKRGEHASQSEIFVRNASNPGGAWLRMSTRPLRRADGTLQGWLVVFGHITAPTRTTAEPSEAHDMEAQVATVLHDVGNVINSLGVATARVRARMLGSRLLALDQLAKLVRSHEHDLADFVVNNDQGRHLPAYLQKLSEQFTMERDDVRASLDALDKNLAHMQELIRMQQDHARGPQSARGQPILPAELIEEAVCIAVANVELRGLQIVRAYADVPRARLDRHAVLKILVNLMRNAVQALDASPAEHKELRIRLDLLDSSRLRIQICDNGVGIPSEDMKSLFQYGFTTREDGHGIGLHSCALAARSVRGNLTAQSDGPGTGATFTLELPWDPAR